LYHPDGKNIIERLEEEKGIDDMTFSKIIEVKMALCDYVPGNINRDIHGDGYKGLFNAYHISPEVVIEEINKSGLKTSGNGIPVWQSWEIFRKNTDPGKCIICDAYENRESPALRAMLEYPHQIIEGMLICALASGACQGYIFVNSGSGEILKKAVRQAVDHLKNDPYKKLKFNLNIIEAKSYAVFDEEPAKISAKINFSDSPFASPFPSLSGVNNHSVIIHTAETWANIPVILQKGSAYFSSYGTENNKGTKIFSLNGSIKNNCAAEVPFGTPLNRLIEDIGGGAAAGIKAVHIGGVQGGFLPPDKPDIQLEHSVLMSKGCIIGTGDIVILNEDTCIVDYVKKIAWSVQASSCGECVICREGTAQIAQIIKDISEGRGKSEDTELMMEICDGLRSSSFCRFGKNASNTVSTGIKYFEDEFRLHIKEKKCPANVCKMNT